MLQRSPCKYSRSRQLQIDCDELVTLRFQLRYKGLHRAHVGKSRIHRRNVADLATRQRHQLRAFVQRTPAVTLDIQEYTLETQISDLFIDSPSRGNGPVQLRRRELQARGTAVMSHAKLSETQRANSFFCGFHLFQTL